MDAPKVPVRSLAASFWPAFWAGLAGTALTYQPNAYRYPHASEADAMRGDWARVGQDLRAVIERERVKTAA